MRVIYSIFIYFALTCVSSAQDAPPSKDTVIQAAVRNIKTENTYSDIKIDYPFEGSLFPPEMVAPTFLWHDTEKEVDQWLIHIDFENAPPLKILTNGDQEELRIDPDAIWSTNKDYQRPHYELTAKAWTPDKNTWELIKENSIETPLAITIWGLKNNGNTITSKGDLRIQTSSDPVGAPIFYRDVPLMPSSTKDGKIEPIPWDKLHIIAWRLRDISKPSAPVLLKNMPTCANCHSFSADGQFLGMDLDGPGGDKGAYGLVDISKEMEISEEDIITWGSYRDSNTPENHSSFGLFSRVSPDGQYVVSTVNESVFVANYQDFRFLQSFYPTR